MGEAVELGRGMRWLLLTCGPMNAAGAVCFTPPCPHARRGFGLPEPDPFYLWVLSAWIAAFGVAFARQGWAGRADRAVLALAAWGKGVFAVLLVAAVPGGPSPLAGVAAAADLALAVVFGVWLWRSAGRGPDAEPGSAADGRKAGRR